MERDEVPDNNAGLTTDGSELIKYETGPAEREGSVGVNSFVKNLKIAVPLKHVSNFWRSLEMPLINCKVHLEMTWIENCVLSSAGDCRI